MVKRALLIAYHYPPIKGSSGLLRTLKFSRYLKDCGWEPIVLSVHPRAYLNTSMDQLSDIPSDIIVHRAFGLDSARHLSIGGKYPSFFAWPDRWNTWAIGGIAAGLGLIKKYDPQVIWSTYPIATAHLIGLGLARLSKKPWIADFRDSMTEADYPTDPKVRKVYQWIERKTVQHAKMVTFTAPSTVSMYQDRYPEKPEDFWKLIYNGYDENDFSGVQPPAENSGKKLWVHAGILYPSERDPSQFFEAVARLKQNGTLSSDSLCIRLRATAHDDYYQPIIERFGIGDIVELAPAIPYQEALNEMINADGLLLFQAASCNHQIPAKLYEYLRANKPIIALTDKQGDTARILMDAGINDIAALNNTDEISELLAKASQADTAMQDLTAQEAVYQQYSRQQQTQVLADLFEQFI